jgi:hypothetical protein
MKNRVGLALIEVALVIAVMYVLGWRDPRFIGPLAGAIAISTLAPPRYSGVVSGLSMMAVGAYYHWGLGLNQIPMALGIIGVFLLGSGLMRMKGK